MIAPETLIGITSPKTPQPNASRNCRSNGRTMGDTMNDDDTGPAMLAVACFLAMVIALLLAISVLSAVK